jgi:hypothetical protein
MPYSHVSLTKCATSLCNGFMFHVLLSLLVRLGQAGRTAFLRSFGTRNVTVRALEWTAKPAQQTLWCRSDALERPATSEALCPWWWWWCFWRPFGTLPVSVRTTDPLTTLFQFSPRHCSDSSACGQELLSILTYSCLSVGADAKWSRFESLS